MIRVALLMSALAVAAPAFAQAAPAPAAAAPAQPNVVTGANVVGPDGGPVGTIASVEGDYAVLKTDKHDVRLPKTAFGARPDGLAIGLTREALNAQVEQSMGKLDDLLKPGTAVAGAQGAPLGTVDAVEGDLVTLKLASGKLVRLPKSGFGQGPNGLVIGLTAQQLAAQAGG